MSFCWFCHAAAQIFLTIPGPDSFFRSLFPATSPTVVEGTTICLPVWLDWFPVTLLLTGGTVWEPFMFGGSVTFWLVFVVVLSFLVSVCLSSGGLTGSDACFRSLKCLPSAVCSLRWVSTAALGLVTFGVVFAGCEVVGVFVVTITDPVTFVPFCVAFESAPLTIVFWFWAETLLLIFMIVGTTVCGDVACLVVPEDFRVDFFTVEWPVVVSFFTVEWLVVVSFFTVEWLVVSFFTVEWLVVSKSVSKGPLSLLFLCSFSFLDKNPSIPSKLLNK